MRGRRRLRFRRVMLRGWDGGGFVGSCIYFSLMSVNDDMNMNRKVLVAM